LRSKPTTPEIDAVEVEQLQTTQLGMLVIRQHDAEQAGRFSDLGLGSGDGVGSLGALVPSLLLVQPHP
jgi:hypothetical protein